MLGAYVGPVWSQSATGSSSFSTLLQWEAATSHPQSHQSQPQGRPSCGTSSPEPQQTPHLDKTMGFYPELPPDPSARRLLCRHHLNRVQAAFPTSTQLNSISMAPNSSQVVPAWCHWIWRALLQRLALLEPHCGGWGASKGADPFSAIAQGAQTLPSAFGEAAHIRNQILELCRQLKTSRIQIWTLKGLDSKSSASSPSSKKAGASSQTAIPFPLSSTTWWVWDPDYREEMKIPVIFRVKGKDRPGISAPTTAWLGHVSLPPLAPSSPLHTADALSDKKSCQIRCQWAIPTQAILKALSFLMQHCQNIAIYRSPFPSLHTDISFSLWFFRWLQKGEGSFCCKKGGIKAEGLQQPCTSPPFAIPSLQPSWQSHLEHHSIWCRGCPNLPHSSHVLPLPTLSHVYLLSLDTNPISTHTQKLKH